jgi:DNA-binding CsgD family transcriptional regulator
MTQQQLATYLAQTKQKPTKLDVLNDREMELISLMASGASGMQITQEMGLDPEGYAKLKEKTRKKLDLKNEMELVQFAAKQAFQARAVGW